MLIVVTMIKDKARSDYTTLVYGFLTYQFSSKRGSRGHYNYFVIETEKFINGGRYYCNANCIFLLLLDFSVES